MTGDHAYLMSISIYSLTVEVALALLVDINGRLEINSSLKRILQEFEVWTDFNLEENG